MFKTLRIALVMALVCSGLSGCAQVAPWERGNLAKPKMAIDPHPNFNGFRDHTFTSKAATQGGHGGGGGGCGCN